MREHHVQTPLKELGNRRSKSISSDQAKKPPLKTTRKNLNSIFESQALSFSESSVDSSLISSAISDDQNLLTESAAEDFLLIPETSPSSEVVDSLAELSPSSLTLTSDKFKECTGSNNSSGVSQISDAKFGFVEAEMSVKCLREAQVQVVNATDIDIRYKKLIDAVMNTVAEEFYGLPEDEDWINAIVSKKFHLVTLTFLLWIIAVSIRLFFRMGENESFYGTLPT
ncbi:protein SINE3 [Capsicum chacoense]